MSAKITQEGQPCRHCGTPVVKKTRDGEPELRKGKAYYFLWWFRCSNKKCGALYMVEEAKRYFAEDDSAHQVAINGNSSR